MSLKEKLLKNSTSKLTSLLADSIIYNNKEKILIPVPAVNVALSGNFDDGLSAGTLVLAAPSKHFKTGFALLMARAFLDKYPDGIILFYDNEFGTPQGYFKSYRIPLDSVVHTPITSIEQLKHDMSVQLEGLDRKDRVMIIIDSMGNLASKKETDDAMDGKTAVDMTRAKAIKSFFRIVTPHLTLKDIPLVVINHTYKTQELYSKDVVSGGTGPYYSADNIWIIGRQQDKDEKTKNIDGYDFIINVEKSRYIKEKSKIPISISYEHGINKWSGFLEWALEGGYVTKPKVGWYALVNRETGEVEEKLYREADIIDNGVVWTKIYNNPEFREFIKEKYTLSMGDIIEQNQIELEDEED